jgi:RHS repeat-associated protein
MAPGAAAPVKELPDERTATSSTFELHSGLRETRVYANPINYKEADGDWEPIDEGLEETDDGAIVNGASSVDVSLPTELQEGAARLTIGEEWIASKLLSIDTEPVEVDSGAAVYESTTANTVFEYTTLPEGLKEDIVLEDPSSPSSVRYALTASAGLSPSLIADGSVVFMDGHGEVLATMPAPTVADAAMIAPSTDQVSYQLAPREGGQWVLTVSVNPDWLAAPGRAWPIHIDPTVTKEPTALDCVIGGKTGQEGWIDCADWGRKVLIAGYNAELNQADDNWYRSLLYLKTSELIHGADLVSADLMLHAPEAAQNTSGVAVHQILKPWNWQANWKRYTSGKNWEAEGGDYAAEPLGQVKVADRGAGAGWWSVPIQIAKVAEAAGKDQNLSVIAKLLDDKTRSCSQTTCTDRTLQFDSSAADPYNRPYLRVLYDFRKAPSASRMISPEVGRISSHEFTLRSAWNPPPLGEVSVTGVTYQVKVPNWDEFRTIPPQYVRDGAGGVVDWPIAPWNNGSTPPVFFDFAEAMNEELWPWAAGDKIQIRAIFAGGPTLHGASEPVTVAYDDHGVPTNSTASVGPVSLDLLTGAFTASRTDVSIPVPGSEANLEFTRVYNSRPGSSASPSSAFGGGWQPSASLESSAEGLAWTKLVERHQPAVPAVYETECWEESGEQECETYMAEEAIPAADWIEVFDNEGSAASFEIAGGSYVAPEYLKEFLLTRDASTGNFLLTGPDRTQIIFKAEGAAGEYVPKTVSWQATSKSAQMVYDSMGNGKYRLTKQIAPAPAGVTCSVESSVTTPGCRTLAFQYSTCTCEGGYRLSSIEYFGPSGTGGQTVARYGYDSSYRLLEEWDPRISAPLKETYAYSAGRLSALTPPGQAPWELAYYEPQEFPLENTWPILPDYNWRDKQMFGALKAVSRASLVESTPTARTTIAYQVPISGSGAPYDLSPGSVAAWGQTDYPVDATAIFPPDQVPGSPRPTDFSRAAVHYLDPEGYEVNSASPAPPGAEGASIETTEVDTHGNVVRELTPQNRLRSLAAGSGSVTLSHRLETRSLYSYDGTELLQSWGPRHKVRLSSGELVDARMHQVIRYDEAAPVTAADTPPAHLPTSEETGAELFGSSQDVDVRLTRNYYNWTLRKPLYSTVDPGGENLLTRQTVYDLNTGMPVEVRQPKTVAGAGATRFIYYSATANAEYPECGQVAKYAGLPCRVMPTVQASGAGSPELLVKRFKAYNNLDEPTEILESAGGKEINVRRTLLEYDAAGRQKARQITGGGVTIPKVETEYSSQLGLPFAQRFKCESECGNPQFLAAIGGSAEGQTPLKDPTDVAIAGDGNIWVVDQSNNRVVVYTEGGKYVREIGGLGSSGGKLSKPSGIAIDSYGTVSVTDTANNRVAQFNASGAFVQVLGSDVNKTKVEAGATALQKGRCTAASGDVCQAGTAGTGNGQMSEPVGITTNTGRHIYVVERANNRVEAFAPEGELLAKIGGPGSGDGQLKEPTAIGYSASLLWVADTGNNRMQAFTTAGVFSRKFGTEGSADGQLKKPTGVEIDSSRNLWVSDQGNSRVQKLTETGGFLLKFGTAGSQEGQFGSLAGVGSDAKGNLFVADAGNGLVQRWSTSFDSQETTTTYDTLGRVTTYKDADGNEAKTTYDYLGRPVTQSDGKGTQTLRYDSVTGLPTELEDSAAGIFTASYDADGQMVKQGLPNGLTREMTVDEAGEATGLTYTKASNCGTSCTWLANTVQRSIRGQILLEDGTLGKDEYAYDKGGRLTTAREALTGGSCTTRTYAYDKDSNRTGMTTIPDVAGACSNSGGTARTYNYDSADRLLATGLTYDDFGRITSLPGEFAGGKTLTTSYFSNDMVASQTQDGVTNSFQLDAMLRHRQRLQAGGLQGTEVFHYASPSDAPAWTERGSIWTRNITGIGGDLAAVQESGKEIELQLSNIHGDVVATAAVNPAATSIKSTSTYDEFGNRTTGVSGKRFAWLGGKQRRTELASGVIQMGARSYIPQVGRFLTPDPVFGGSANTYDYGNGDPINQFDLDGTKAARCSFKMDNPHSSHHRKGRVNAVFRGGCFGPDVAKARIRVRLTMFRNGKPIATTPAKSYDVWIHPSPIKKPEVRVPFADAPVCKDGTYFVLAEVTLFAPPEYSPKVQSAAIISRKVTIEC